MARDGARVQPTGRPVTRPVRTSSVCARRCKRETTDGKRINSRTILAASVAVGEAAASSPIAALASSNSPCAEGAALAAVAAAAAVVAVDVAAAVVVALASAVPIKPIAR